MAAQVQRTYHPKLIVWSATEADLKYTFTFTHNYQYTTCW